LGIVEESRFQGFGITTPESLEGMLISLRVCPGTSSGITKFSEHEAD
jgi:hypothetical protein